MTISFTQTYGNRPLLLEIYSKDKKLIDFKNQFNLDLYSFHNTHHGIIEKFKSINQVKNTRILVFENLLYGEVLKKIKNLVKKIIVLTFFSFRMMDSVMIMKI